MSIEKVSKNNYKRLIEDYVTFGNRLDTSGIRGQGMRRPERGRLEDYPYDSDPDYGQPNRYDRGNSASRAGNAGNGITPKDIENTAWDDAVDEVSGYPVQIGKSGNGSGGSSGGRTIAGTSGGWSNKPTGGDFDDKMDDDDLVRASQGKSKREEGFIPQPTTNPIYKRKPPDNPSGHDPTEDEIEALLSPRKQDMAGDRKKSTVLKIGGGTFGTNMGKNTKTARFQPGFSFREAINNKKNEGFLMKNEIPWEVLNEAFVSLRDVPENEKHMSTAVREVEGEELEKEFNCIADKVGEKIENADAWNSMKIVSDLDFEQFTNYLVKDKKINPNDIYNEWVANSIERYKCDSDHDVLNKCIEKLNKHIEPVVERLNLFYDDESNKKEDEEISR